MEIDNITATFSTNIILKTSHGESLEQVCQVWIAVAKSDINETHFCINLLSKLLMIRRQGQTHVHNSSIDTYLCACIVCEIDCLF